jgi:predicted transcriptional regulator
VAATSIRVSQELKRALDRLKLHPFETYEEVIERLLEDLRELNGETKREIERAVREIKAGKSRTQAKLKTEKGF